MKNSANETRRARSLQIDLPNRREFYRRADEILTRSGNAPYAIAAIDIDFFKLFNELFGRDAGDDLIAATAKNLRDLAEETGGIAGYFGGDNFAVLVPWEDMTIDELKARITMEAAFRYKDGFLPSFGLYVIEDNGEAIDDMYDRALMALNRIKGSYSEHARIYDPLEHDRMRDEHMLLVDAQHAVRNGDFTFYIQPKCNLKDGRIIGSEALIRWIDPKAGVLAPNVFIPVLEQDGYITVVDQYIWEEVCKWQRRLLDEGPAPLPCSVNVSRVDFYFVDVAERFRSLAERYRLPPELLELEITESAFADVTLAMNESVSKLHDYGFTVLLDDFGTGASSLNMLRLLKFDVLKTDIRFLDSADAGAGNVTGLMRSVHSMARRIGVPVIVEGTETNVQVKELREIGCDYAQGYYFHKPMTREAFEDLIRDERNVDRSGLRYQRTTQMNVRDFLDENLYSDATLNNILGAVAFVELNGGKPNVVCANEPFCKMFGKEPIEGDVMGSLSACLGADEKKVMDLLTLADRDLTDGGSDVFLRPGQKDPQLHAHAYFLNSRDGRRLYYVNFRGVDVCSPPMGGAGWRERALAGGILRVTAAEMKEILLDLQPLFDIVRLVDPVPTAELSLSEQGQLIKDPHRCFELWQRGRRCENCSSWQAVMEKKRITKLECLDGVPYFVTSQYVEVDGQPCALEMVSRCGQPPAGGTPAEGNSVEDIRSPGVEVC